MNRADIFQYCKYLALQAGFPQDNIDDHIDACIKLGFEAFWGAKPWQFASKQYTMTYDDSNDAQSLPDDFLGFRSVRETITSGGMELIYYPKGQFDNGAPARDKYGSGNPRVFTVYRDMDDNARWKALFAPQPSSGDSIYWDYFIKADESYIDYVPESHTMALLAQITYFLYPVGSTERMAALAELRTVMKEVEVNDTPFKGRLFYIRTLSDATIETDWPWM